MPQLTPAFEEEPGACGIERTLFENSDPSKALFRIDDTTDAGIKRLVFTSDSNKQIQSYDKDANGLNTSMNCDLSVVGTQFCELDYTYEAVTVNGTVGI